MGWIFDDNPPSTGQVFGLPRLLVVILWLGLGIGLIALLNRVNLKAEPSKSFAICIVPSNGDWVIAPLGRLIPRHPLVPTDDDSDAIRCLITTEWDPVNIGLWRRGGDIAYRCTATLTIEPLGGRYTTQFCEQVVNSLCPQLAAAADRTRPGRALASSIDNAGETRYVVDWSSLAAGVVMLVMIFGAVLLAIDGDREAGCGRWATIRSTPRQGEPPRSGSAAAPPGTPPHPRVLTPRIRQRVRVPPPILLAEPQRHLPRLPAAIRRSSARVNNSSHFGCQSSVGQYVNPQASPPSEILPPYIMSPCNRSSDGTTASYSPRSIIPATSVRKARRSAGSATDFRTSVSPGVPIGAPHPAPPAPEKRPGPRACGSSLRARPGVYSRPRACSSGG